jgi:hypothetical protein
MSRARQTTLLDLVQAVSDYTQSDEDSSHGGGADQQRHGAFRQPPAPARPHRAGKLPVAVSRG